MTCPDHPPRRGLLSGLRVVVFFALVLALLGAHLRAAPARKQFDLPAGEAAVTLKRFAAQSGFQVIYAEEAVRGESTRAVVGLFAPEEAIARMLAGTRLAFERDERSGGFAVRSTATRASAAPAPPAGFGSLEGRVLDPASGEFLEGARVVVDQAALETFTDAEGRYRFGSVPAGMVTVAVFYTGFPTQRSDVAIEAGAPKTHDVSLLPAAPTAAAGAGADAVVKLGQFVVATQREMSAAALAINEQRFAANIKTVVSTDEFGIVSEGNVGEFLKYLPGVTVDAAGGTPRWISINGVPSDNVPITIDGISLASASVPALTGRLVDIDMISINNASRVEVSFSPTPESQGGALAGSVNIVPRSAFERSKPQFKGSAYLTFRDDSRGWETFPGPRRNARRFVNPGFDFSYVAPLSKRFGFTLSGGYSGQHSRQDTIDNQWRGVAFPTNGAAFPHTTSDRPYLTTHAFHDEPKLITRRSVGVTFDFKLTPADRLSLAFQYSSFDVDISHSILTFNVGRVLAGDFTPTATRGAPGAGSLVLQSRPRHRFNRTYMPSLSWRHIGSIWRFEAGAGLSNAYDKNNQDTPGFNIITARRTGVTVAFDDIFYLRPGRVTVTDSATGAAVDPFRLATYEIVSGSFEPRTVRDQQRTFYANARRDFAWGAPFTLKGGVELREAQRDLVSQSHAYAFVPAAGRSASAAPFVDETFSERVPPFGYPRMETLSDEKFSAYFAANPTHFRLDQNNQYRSAVTNSKHALELVSAAYVRGDLGLLERRLKLVGGLRAEQTNVEAEGPLSDLSRNFQRDPATGRVRLDSLGRPVPISTVPFEVAQRTLFPRATRAEKEYLRLFPSLNASFALRENFIARAAYYHSVGRPNFNQYAGGITLPDLDEGPTPTNRIVVNNAGIKAWSARTVNARIEYYFAGVGQMSLGAFRREFKNFFGGTELIATPEFLALYGLDPALYGDYRVATQYNAPGLVLMTGFDVSYKQALTFLPHWARGLQVFANGSSQRATGAQLGAFAGSNYLPRSGSIGVSLTRERYSLRTNLNYRSYNRRGAVAAGPSIGPGTYNWALKRSTLDFIGEYQLRKNVALFAHLRDVGAATEDTEAYNAETPAHAQLRGRRHYGSLWTFGVRGTF